MSGLLTNGLPAYTLPFTGIERINLDTGAAGGANPQSAAITMAQLSASGLGAVSAFTDAAVVALNAATASQFSDVLSATGRTVTISNASPGQEVVLYLSQDATGSRTVTTWTNVLWAAGAPPTLSTAANALDVFRFTFNATLGKFIGETVGKAFA